jgi:hypothetical protein
MRIHTKRIENAFWSLHCGGPGRTGLDVFDKIGYNKRRKKERKDTGT